MITHIPYWWYLNMYRWQDAVEILFFSLCIFYLSRWFAQDDHKPLLTLFYSYCGAILITFHTHMNTVSTLLITFLPLMVALFILIHHETLQKNFISLHAITPLKKPSDDWIKALVRTGLISAGDNKPLLAVIEKKQALDTLISGENTLEAPVSLSLLHTITTSTLYHPEKILWIDAHAHIKAFNATWQKNSVDAWLTQEVKSQNKWLQDALFFTKKTDALIVSLNPLTRTFTLVHEGKTIEHLSAQNAYTNIKQYLGHSFNQLQGESHGFFTKNITSEQRAS